MIDEIERARGLPQRLIVLDIYKVFADNQTSEIQERNRKDESEKLENKNIFKSKEIIDLSYYSCEIL